MVGIVVAPPRADGKPTSSSWLEPTANDDRLLVLRHVCLESHRIHFFGNATARQLFERKREPYRVWQGNPISRKAPPTWAFESVDDDALPPTPYNSGPAATKHNAWMAKNSNWSVAEWMLRDRMGGVFEPVRALDDFRKHAARAARDTQLRQLLERLQQTDVFIGLHGAGMGHIFYLNAKSAVVELKDHFWYEQHKILIYQSMARLQGAGYMAADVRRAPSTSAGYVLNETQVAKLGREAQALWQRTQTTPADGNCHSHRGMMSCRVQTIVL